MASKWWAAETWGTHTQLGTVTADRISELLVKLRQDHLLAEGRKGPMCRLQMEGSGLTVEMGNNSAIKYPLDNIVFCHVDSALPDAIVWVVRQENNELRACVFKCERPGAAICLYTTFNDLHRRNRMDNRKRYLTSTVTSPKGPNTQESTLVATTSPTDSYGRIRAQVVAELQNKLSKNLVQGTYARAVVRKDVQDGGEGVNGLGVAGGTSGAKRVAQPQERSDPKDLKVDSGRFQCGMRPMPCDATLKGGYCCCWTNQSKKCRCSSVGVAAFEKAHCIAQGGPGNNTMRKQSNAWPVSSVVKKLLNRKKNAFQGPGLGPEPEVTVRRVLPSGGYGLEAKSKQVAPAVPLFWSPPPIRTGAILLPVLPPKWVSAHSKPLPMVNQGTNGRMRLLRRRGSTGSDNVELSSVWGTGTLLPVYQTGSEHPPRSVMKKKAPPIPVASVKKNVTFHAFATVQVMNC